MATLYRMIAGLHQRQVLTVLGLATLVLLLPLRALAGDDGPPPGADSPPWNGETFRHLVDAKTGVAFDVPTLGFRLQTRHFDRKTPAFRIKDSFTISGPDGLEVTIDVFHNPDGLRLEKFFDTHLGFMRTSEAAVSDGNASARKVPALFVEQPRAPGSFAQPSAIFAIGSRIFRVTCFNEDDERAVKVYLRVLASLDIEKVAP